MELSYIVILLIEIAVVRAGYNVALNKPTAISSNYHGTDLSMKAVDGTLSQIYYPDQECFHTAPSTDNWWYVDLQATYTITNIVVYNRGDCCADRARQIKILVGNCLDDLSEAVFVEQLGSIDNIAMPANTVGRYVKFSQQIPEGEQLHLCEIEVYSGGTADISVHEKKEDGTLKELHKASGGPWGGYAVDINYINWLINVFGDSTMERFRLEQMADYFDIHREFETKKRTITSDTEGKVTFRVSASMREMYQEKSQETIKQKIASIGLSDKVVCTGDKLRVDVSIVRSWFQGPISNTLAHIKAILSEPKMAKIKVILLVGGFGECQLVQDVMKLGIQNKRLIVPNEAGLAVLKGAVRFGQIASLTYGMQVKIPFNANVHPSSKMVIVNGKMYAEWVFAIFVAKGHEISIGHEVRKGYTPTSMLRTDITLFSSNVPNPQFVDDPGCTKLGYMNVMHPEGDCLLDKKFEVTFVFGDTELHVKVKILKSGKEYKQVIDCL